MAEVRKFDETGSDELQKLVRQQIGDTMLPKPSEAPEPGDSVEDPGAAPAVSELPAIDSFLLYGDNPEL